MKGRKRQKLEDKRQVWDRREEDRRRGERRGSDQRKGDRRIVYRRQDFCPTCGGLLTLTSYCPSCKVRVVKIRPIRNRRAV